VIQGVRERLRSKRRKQTTDRLPRLLVSRDPYDEQLIHVRAEIRPSDAQDVVRAVIYPVVRQLAAP
jgi:hypothetical protein